MSPDGRKCFILSIPVEVRFMIINAIWNTTTECDSHQDKDVESDSHEDKGIDSDNALYFKGSDEDLTLINHQLAAVTALKNLAHTCSQIRKEVITEFFTNALSRTQIHLGSAYGVPRSYFRCRGPGHKPPQRSKLAVTNDCIFAEMRESLLFTKNLRHVSLHWGGCYCWQGTPSSGTARQPDGVLNWLGNCQQLTTLELIFTDPLYCTKERFTKGWIPGVARPDEPWEQMWQENDLFCQDCRRKLVGVMSTLDKVVGRPWYPHGNPDIAGRFYTIVFRQNGEWVTDEWFLEDRDTVKQVEQEGDEVDAVVKKVPEEFEFKHHFGAIKVVWPLADSI